ncbi:hypothetical protein [Streptomyces aureoverticillatus]|nr:hypothetical protein [Streptomyces aureoverticillatus]
MRGRRPRGTMFLGVVSATAITVSPRLDPGRIYAIAIGARGPAE